MQHILFIELLGGLGDLLIALPAMQALAASHPAAKLTVLTFAPGGDLLQSHPLIHRVIQTPQGTTRQSVEQLLSTQFYDLILTDTTYAGIAELIRQSKTSRTLTNLWRNPPKDEFVSDRFLKILQQEQLITPAAAAQHRLPQLYIGEATDAIYSPMASGPKICLYPDAGMAIKRWHPEHFLTLGQQLQQRYGAQIFVPVGSDQAQATTLAAQIPQAKIWPRGNLPQLATFLSRMDAVVAADTGPARIAAALRVPTITLFGPSWANRYGQPAPHINVQAYPHCPERRINFTEQICWYSGNCPFPWRTCTDLITPAQVLATLDSTLNSLELKEHQTPKPNKLKLNSPLFYQPEPSRQSDWPMAQNLLVIRLDNLGDVIMTGPALRAIKTTLPQTRLTLLASPAGSQAASVLPWIDSVITWRALWQDLGKLPLEPEREWQLVDQLAAHQFDGAIIFTSFRQSPHPAAFICQLAGIPLRLGESQERDAATLTHALKIPDPTLHQVERNLQLVESVGYRAPSRALALQIPNSSQVPDEPYLLLNPWTSCQARTYPPEKLAIAAYTLSLHTGYPVVVTGTPRQTAEAQPLLETLGPRGIDRVGQTTVEDLVALVAQAKLLLSNNTATMHIADATQTPSVILFSGTELVSQWQPRHTRAILLQEPTPCSPCYQFTCPYQLECLDIAPETIVQKGLSLLEMDR